MSAILVNGFEDFLGSNEFLGAAIAMREEEQPELMSASFMKYSPMIQEPKGMLVSW